MSSPTYNIITAIPYIPGILLVINTILKNINFNANNTLGSALNHSKPVKLTQKTNNCIYCVPYVSGLHSGETLTPIYIYAKKIINIT